MTWLYQPYTPPATATSYSLTCQKGTVTLTGGDATLVRRRKLVCQKGVLVLGAMDADLVHRREIQAQGGTISLTGGDADLARHRKVDAQGGTVTLTGGDATLTIGSAPSNSYSLTCLKGVLHLRGGSATLNVRRDQQTYGGGYYDEPDPFEDEFDDDMEIIQLSMHFLARAA